MFFTADDTDAVETEISGGSGSGVYVVGPGAAKSQQGIVLVFPGFGQIVFELSPFVAAEMRVNQIITFNENVDPGLFQERTVQLL